MKEQEYIFFVIMVMRKGNSIMEGFLWGIFIFFICNILLLAVFVALTDK